MNSRIRSTLKSIHLASLNLQVRVKGIIWSSLGNNYPDYHSVPIIINNFNRLGTLKRLLSSLELRGYNNIHILDNDSSYPPLLEWYKTSPYHIIFLNCNMGHRALWESDVFSLFRNGFYVYTDSDIELDDDCPEDFMKHFLEIMREYPACMKVGFGLRIDDLPDSFSEKKSVIEWESQFWANPERPGLYNARIDTTFALYRPWCKGGSTSHQMFRTGKPYVAKHLPWYQDSLHLSEEEKYYVSHVRKETHWTEKIKVS